MVEEIRTFGDIQDKIISNGKLRDDDSTRDDLKEKINTCQNLLAFEEHYSWSGETRPFIFEAKYTTGTVAVTNGSYSVTGSSTSWSGISFIEGYRFLIPGDKVSYKVKRLSSEVLTLDSPYNGTTGSGKSYILYKEEYGMFPDLMEIRSIRIPNKTIPLEPVGPHFIDEMRSRNIERSGDPICYTLNGYNYYKNKTWATFLIDTDFWEDDPALQNPRNKNLIIYPAIFSTDVPASIRYTKIPPPMETNEEEPMIYYELRSILVYGVLIRWFLKDRDFQTQAQWKREYDFLKMKMASDIESTHDIMSLKVNTSRFLTKRASGNSTRSFTSFNNE